MSHTSEIDKLERRYAENPQGRNFAPLADAYRKAGQVDQAIELCTSGLEHHPDYVSAHIVLGRCFIDKRNDAEAEKAFRRILELDPENVIAFKVLAEIAARGGRFDDAVAWLTRLLIADPMNGEAAETLSATKRKAAQTAKTSGSGGLGTGAEPLVRAVPDAATEALEHLALAVGRASAQPVEAAAAEPPPAPPDLSGSDLETFDGTLNFNAVANEAPQTEGLQLEEEIRMDPTPIAIEGLAQTQYDASGVFKMDTPLPPEEEASAEASPEPELDDLPTVDLPLIMPDDVSRPGTRRTPEFTAPPVPLPPPLPPPPPPPSPVAPPPSRTRATPSERTSTPVAAAVALSDDDGAADTVALSRAEPVLTETMAELYLRQGHREDARRVYDALLEQRPGDRRLRARVQDLFGGGSGPSSSGETVRSFLKGILTRRPAEASPPAPAGSPLDSAFARTPAEGQMPGKPTHAAGGDISLDDVFGVESPQEPASAPVPMSSAPAADGSAGEPSGKEAGGGGFSFDEFFAAKGAPGASAAPDDAKAPARASGTRAKPQGEEDGDLDQFQAWLKGLKS